METKKTTQTSDKTKNVKQTGVRVRDKAQPRQRISSMKILEDMMVYANRMMAHYNVGWSVYCVLIVICTQWMINSKAMSICSICRIQGTHGNNVDITGRRVKALLDKGIIEEIQLSVKGRWFIPTASTQQTMFGLVKALSTAA